MSLSQNILILNTYFLIFLNLSNLSGVGNFESSDLFYQSTRYYDSKISHFISPDTVVPNPLKPQALNRYCYVYNNPIKYADPSGHAPVGGGWIDRIIDAFFGDRSRPPPPSYSGSVGGNSYGSFMSQRALDSQQLDDNVIKLAAGAAVAARETEIKTVAASIGGLFDGAQLVNPNTYMNPEYYTHASVPPRSEILFDLVELDLKEDPLMKVPYAAGFSAAPALILISRFQSPPQPRGLPAPPQVRPIRTVRPRPGRRDVRDLRPGEVPVIVGGAPEHFDFDDPYRYKDFEPGSLVHEYSDAHSFKRVWILSPQTMGDDGAIYRTQTRIMQPILFNENLPRPPIDFKQATIPHKVAYIFFKGNATQHPQGTFEFASSGIIQADGSLRPMSTEALFYYEQEGVIYPKNPSDN